MIRTTAITLGCLLLATHCQAKDRWPGFLGAGASEITTDGMPSTWTPESLAWKTEVPGYGQSSPVIWEDRVFVTCVDGAEKERLLVLCLGLADGEVIWSWEGKSGFTEKNSVYVSRAAPTPCVDANGVYAYFESGDVVALDFDGQERWTRSLTKDYGEPTNRFGLAASPVQTGDQIAIMVDDPASAYLVSLKKSDGSVAWKTDRGERGGWSSPFLVTVDGTPQIVCSSFGSVDGYDPATGDSLWTFADVGGNTAATPVDAGDGTFLVAASPGRRGENSESAKKSNGLMKIARDGDGWKADFVWRTPDATPSFASPILYDGYAYWISRAGIYCIDAKDGSTAYRERLESSWATPIGVGDRVWLFGKDGLTTVIRTGGKFEVVSENSLWSDEKPPVNNLPAADNSSPERASASAGFSKPVLYGAAVVNGRLVLRSGSQVYCVTTDGAAK